MQQTDVIRLYESLADDWDLWERRNAFYRSALRAHFAGIIPAGAAVLELAAGMGQLLHELAPRAGVGVNYAERLNAEARKRHPELTFVLGQVDRLEVPAGFVPEYVVLNHMIDFVHDLWDSLHAIAGKIEGNALVAVTTSNPLWAPILRLASALRLRTPHAARNFVTARDVRSVLELLGFDVVEEGWLVPMPLGVPGLARLVNLVVPEIPILRAACSVQSLTARRRLPRAGLTCTVIIPCHNEEGNLEATAARVPAMGARTEILVVDDGSTDGTRAAAERARARDPRVRILAFDKNRGKAGAVFAAIEAATGDVAIILDADATVPPEVLPKFFEALATGHADFVNGTRLVYPVPGKAMKIANFLGNKMFCFIASWVLRQRVSDTLCGTKAFLRSDFLRMPRLSVDRWGDFTLLFGAARLRLRIREIPVHYEERTAGRSKMRAFVEVWRFLAACARGWRLMRRPRPSDFPAVVPPVATPAPLKRTA
jgi:hypothetical protein